MKTPKKAELITENAKLKSELELMGKKVSGIRDNAEKADQEVREHLSIALGAGTYSKGIYSNDHEQIVYNWHAIFRELGKLLEKKNYVDLKDITDSHRMQLEEMQNRINEIDPPEQYIRR